MSAAESLTTTVSTKGKVILPKAIRERRRWTPGTRLVVEDTSEGVLLKPAPLFATTRPEDVAGMLAYRGPTKTLEEMDAAITAEAQARRARGRLLMSIANIVVRYLTADHPEQFAKAGALVEHEDVFVSTTVLLETEWVLRRAYRFDRDRTVAALAAFAGLPRVRLEAAAVAAKALDWTQRGMDFADALHLASAAGCDAFVSFDRQLAAAAMLWCVRLERRHEWAPTAGPAASRARLRPEGAFSATHKTV